MGIVTLACVCAYYVSAYVVLYEFDQWQFEQQEAGHCEEGNFVGITFVEPVTGEHNVWQTTYYLLLWNWHKAIRRNCQTLLKYFNSENGLCKLFAVTAYTLRIQCCATELVKWLCITRHTTTTSAELLLAIAIPLRHAEDMSFTPGLNQEGKWPGRIVWLGAGDGDTWPGDLWRGVMV